MKKATMIPGEAINWIPRLIVIVIVFIIFEMSILFFLSREVNTANLENNLVIDSVLYSKCFTEKPGVIDTSKISSECIKLKDSAMIIQIKDFKKQTLKEVKINEEFYEKNKIFCTLKEELDCLTRTEYIFSKQGSELIPSIISIEVISQNEK